MFYWICKNCGRENIERKTCSCGNTHTKNADFGKEIQCKDEQGAISMSLRDFLRKKTNAPELCVIRRDGWIVATCWIDCEDSFHVPSELADKEVKRDEWGYLPIVNENNATVKVPCHYVDV